jgi:hypothetical protein
VAAECGRRSMSVHSATPMLLVAALIIVHQYSRNHDEHIVGRSVDLYRSSCRCTEVARLAALGTSAGRSYRKGPLRVLLLRRRCTATVSNCTAFGLGKEHRYLHLIGTLANQHIVHIIPRPGKLHQLIVRFIG